MCGGLLPGLFAMPYHLLKRALGRFLPDRSAAPVDDRGRRFVAVIDCILNQNARDLGAARFPAMNIELLNLCCAHQVGVLQMPCPEIAALGFVRARAPGQNIRAALDTEHGRRCCAQLAVEVADRIAIYRSEGYELVGVLGGNARSPGCAVHCGEPGKLGLTGESGVFMLALQAEFARRAWEVPFLAVRDADRAQLDEDLRGIRGLLAGEASP